VTIFFGKILDKSAFVLALMPPNVFTQQATWQLANKRHMLTIITRAWTVINKLFYILYTVSAFMANKDYQ